MLRTVDELKDYAIHATDGDVGRVNDLYFDDAGWAIRYLVVETGNWLLQRKVLISPIAIGKPDWENKTLPVNITKDQVKNSPDINTDKPVSRQHENDYLGYYGYPLYWDGGSMWGEGMYPGLTVPGVTPLGAAGGIVVDASYQEALHKNDDSHLRSCKEVTSYHIHAIDGDIGHVSGMLIDEQTWAIRYLIVDTSNWWLGHQVLIAPLWIDQVQWPDARVTVKLTRQAVQNSIPYDRNVRMDRTQEVAMHEHYQREGYWEREQQAKNNDKFEPED